MDNDNNKLYEFIQEEIENPDGFIWSVMKKKNYDYTIRNWNFMDKDDLLQEGWVSLLQAAKNYDKDFNKDFGWYAFYWVNQRLGMIVDNNIDKEKHETSWREGYEIEDMGGKPTRLDKIIERMSKEDQEIVELAKEGYTQEEIGERLDIPQRTVSYRLNNLDKYSDC